MKSRLIALVLGVLIFMVALSFWFKVSPLIDTCTKLLGIEPLTTKTSAELACAFKNSWLLHYPHPLHVVHDQGPKFMGQEFSALLNQIGIKDVPATA